MDRVWIGDGVFTWPRYERITGRYGLMGVTDLIGSPIGLPGLQPPGSLGRLEVEIVDTRPSPFQSPPIPKAGDRFEFGPGYFFTGCSDGITWFGLQPVEPREENWLDPKKLNQCHGQVVRVYWLAARSEP